MVPVSSLGQEKIKSEGNLKAGPTMIFLFFSLSQKTHFRHKIKTKVNSYLTFRDMIFQDTAHGKESLAVFFAVVVFSLACLESLQHSHIL